MPDQPPNIQLAIVVPIDPETQPGWEHFVAVYLSKPGRAGTAIRNVSPGMLTSLSRLYQKEKKWKNL